MAPYYTSETNEIIEVVESLPIEARKVIRDVAFGVAAAARRARRARKTARGQERRVSR